MVYATGGSVYQPMGGSPAQMNAELISMEASLHVVLDDPKEIGPLQAAGCTVIFRRTSDDHAYEKYDPVAFVQMLHALAPAGAWLHLGNEPGRGNLPKLNTWTLAALTECRRLGRVGVAFNFSTGEPEEVEWALLNPCLDYIVATGQWVGLHEYYLNTIEQGIADQHVKRCYVLRRLRPTINIVMTEIGMVTGLVWVNGVWMYNPNAGWQAGSSAEAAGTQAAKGILEVWSKINAPVTNFLEGFWDRTPTFDTRGQAVFFQKVRDANRIVKQGSVPMSGKKTVTITSGVPLVNIRALPSTAGRILLQIPSGTVVFALNQQIEDGRQTWQALDFGTQTAWLSLAVVRLT